ncbi:DUF6809 family protein, partial [Paenibacillus barengoltzii]|uniref:DUF6809 family protein n=1 Tax=Paenibacillus barengoltzii TaxID=343517 RepID=UPI003879415E
APRIWIDSFYPILGSPCLLFSLAANFALEGERGMKSIVEEIFYGNLRPEERIVPRDPDYRPLNKKNFDLMQEAKESFSEKDFATLEQILDLNGESNSMVIREAFVQGFRMGTLVMIEVFCEEGGKR